MIAHTERRIVQLSKQLTETLMAAAICAREIQLEARAESDAHDAQRSRLAGNDPSNGAGRPLLDQSTLRVLWRGRSLHLGHTRAFWLLERLSRRPSQYVTHLDLLRDVWDDEDAPVATIRSVVRHLRRRLVLGGMEELAAAIRGHNGRYILEL